MIRITDLRVTFKSTEVNVYFIIILVCGAYEITLFFSIKRFFLSVLIILVKILFIDLPYADRQ